MPDAFTITAAGAGALLLDVADGGFDERRQARLWAVAAAFGGESGVTDVVPGMNNLMVVFDPLAVDPEAMERRLAGLWQAARADDRAGREHVIPVVYGGADIAGFAARLGMGVDEVIERHAGGVYRVAAVGAMPGFPYLSGLDPALAMPRLAVPRQGVPKGAVIIGGSQAGIMPITAPSGWHIVGQTDFVLFDPTRAEPAALSPGDRVRFAIAGVAP